MKRIILYLLCISGLFLVSCNQNSDTTINTSSETEVTGFYFAAHDSFPIIRNTTFTISHYASQDTGLIANADSMTYLTPVTKMVPRFTFKATPASATVFYADTAIVLKGSDTLDMTYPVLVRIISSDLTATKYYRLKVNVHQVDPDLFSWEQLSSAVVTESSASTKGLVLNNRFFLFANNGFTNTVYQSADGKVWDGGAAPSGLPDNCRIRDILATGDKLYYCQDGKVYTSDDAIAWKEQDLTAETYLPRVMLMHFNDSVWLVSEHASAHTFHLSVEDGGTWRTYPQALPANWPLTDFTAVEFRASSERPRAMIIGGYDTQGNGLHSRWNIEYTAADGYRYANFAIERPVCSAILGASVVSYGKRFYLFGGVDAEAQYVSSTALYSDDEGLNWFPVDTTHNHLMNVYTPRTQTSALVHDNAIYLFGGQTRTETFSDVLKGKLTSIDW